MAQTGTDGDCLTRMDRLSRTGAGEKPGGGMGWKGIRGGMRGGQGAAK